MVHELLSDAGSSSTRRPHPGGGAQPDRNPDNLAQPDQWTVWTAGPPHSVEMATWFGGLDQLGEYVVLMK